MLAIKSLSVFNKSARLALGLERHTIPDPSDGIVKFETRILPLGKDNSC
jgi:hypothetical protein